MATVLDAQEIVTASECDFCQIPEGMIWYAILAALIDVENGDPVPTDNTTLLEEASCLACGIPEGMVPYAILNAVRAITSGNVTCGNGVPGPAPVGSCGLYYDKLTQVIYQWDGAGWV